MEQTAGEERLASLLLPYQQRWIADQADVKIAEKSRRIGLTWAEALDSVLAAAPAGGLDTWYVGYNREMAREFIDDCADWVQMLKSDAQERPTPLLVRDEERDIQAYEIRFASGRKITALSSSPRNLRGKEGRAVLDEAAFHAHLPALLKAALAFLMWGGKVRVISTHDGAESAFNQLLIDTCAGKNRDYSIHRITFADAVGEGLYRKICARTRREWSKRKERAWVDEMYRFYGEDAGEELDVIPNASAGAFLPASLIEARMTGAASRVVRWSCDDDFGRASESDRARAGEKFCAQKLAPLLSSIDADARCAIGVDFARDGDLSVIWALARGADRVARTALVVELRNVPFHQQDQVLFFIGDRLPHFSAAEMDARGNGRYLAESAQGRFGAKIIAVTMAREWYQDAMPRMRRAFEDAAIEIPDDADEMNDLRALRLEDGIAKPPEKRSRGLRDRGKRHGDGAIALALAVHALDSRPREYGYIRVAPAVTLKREHPRAEDDSPRSIAAQMEACF